MAAAGLMSCQSSRPGGASFSSVPPLSAEAANAAGLSPQQVNDANTLYATKCAKCHKFYDPAVYSDKEWEVWMRKMSRKSRLKPAQEELLREYLGAYRAKQEMTPAIPGEPAL